MVPGQLDFQMQKNEVWLLPHTIYKFNLKWINGLNITAKPLWDTQVQIF